MGTLFQHFQSLQRNGRLYLISNTIQAASAGAIGVLYTLYLDALGYGTNFIGVVLFFGVLGAGVALVPAAPLVHKLGWRAMLLWSDWVGGIAIVLQLLLPQPVIIFATSFVAGASFAVILIITTPLLTTYSPPESRTAVFGLNSALGLLAAVVGSVLGGVAPEVFQMPSVAHSGAVQAIGMLLSSVPRARTYQLSMLALGVTAIPSIIPIYMMREDARGAADAPAALTEVESAAVSPSSTMPDAITPDALVAPSGVLSGSLREGTVLRHARVMGAWVRAQVARAPSLLSSIVGRFSLTQALLGFGAGLYAQYLNIYFVKDLHTTTAFFGVLAAALMIIQAATALLSAPYAERFGLVRGPALALLCSLPFLVLLGFGPTLVIIALAYLTRGAFTSMAGPPLQAFLMESVPERMRVVASEAFNVSFQIAGALGIVVGGQLIASIGFHLTFLVAAVFYILCAVLLLFWFVRQRPFVVSARSPSDAAASEPIEPVAGGGART